MVALPANPQQVSCKYDQDVDAPELLDRRSDRFLRLLLAGHVEWHEREPVACRLADGGPQLLEIARGGDDAVPRLQSGPDDARANAAACSRDKPDLVHDA